MNVRRAARSFPHSRARKQSTQDARRSCSNSCARVRTDHRTTHVEHRPLSTLHAYLRLLSAGDHALLLVRARSMYIVELRLEQAAEGVVVLVPRGLRGRRGGKRARGDVRERGTHRRGGPERVAMEEHHLGRSFPSVMRRVSVEISRTASLSLPRALLVVFGSRKKKKKKKKKSLDLSTSGYLNSFKRYSSDELFLYAYLSTRKHHTERDDVAERGAPSLEYDDHMLCKITVFE